MNRLRVVREHKPFAPLDLLVYALLLALIAVFFAVFVFGDEEDRAEGIRVEVRGETVYTFVYGDAGGTIAPGWEDRIAEREEEGFIVVTIVLPEGGQNVLQIDGAARSAYMADADCSRRKDCTGMQPIEHTHDVIVCLPHELKVLALNGTEDVFHPTVG